MKQDIYPKKEEFNKLVSHDGYSLRINAFFAWLRRSGYTLEYIAERLATTPNDIVLRLSCKRYRGVDCRVMRKISLNICDYA